MEDERKTTEKRRLQQGQEQLEEGLNRLQAFVSKLNQG